MVDRNHNISTIQSKLVYRKQLSRMYIRVGSTGLALLSDYIIS